MPMSEDYHNGHLKYCLVSSCNMYNTSISVVRVLYMLLPQLHGLLVEKSERAGS